MFRWFTKLDRIYSVPQRKGKLFKFDSGKIVKFINSLCFHGVSSTGTGASCCALDTICDARRRSTHAYVLSKYTADPPPGQDKPLTKPRSPVRRKGRCRRRNGHRTSPPPPSASQYPWATIGPATQISPHGRVDQGSSASGSTARSRLNSPLQPHSEAKAGLSRTPGAPL